MRTLLGRVALAAAAAAAAPAPAQTATTTDERLNRAEQRLDLMEREVRARDARIAELEGQLARRAATTAPAGAPATAPAAGTPPDEIERTRRAVLEDIDRRAAAGPLERVAQSFNPDVAVVADFVGSVSAQGDRSNDAYNRMDVREVELDVRAPVDPRADGVFIVAFEHEVENPIFAHGEDGEEEEEHGLHTGTHVEEAYLFLHDFGVPNLTAKLGRFRVRFGRQNVLHLHDLPTTDPAFVNQALLSPEAYGDAGVSLSYVVPPAYALDQYVEAVVEVLSGEGADSESPVFGGDFAVDSPMVNAHLLWNADLADGVNLELGGSVMTGHRDADNALDATLYGVDVTLLRRDPTGGFNSQLLQAEAIYGVIDSDEAAGDRNYPLGAYVLGQQQLDRDWYAGVRVDWTESPEDDAVEVWGVTPYLSWYWSEFLRFRASYQHRNFEAGDENVLWVQVTWLFGAHPPHPYWSMR
jgi:hypothetical protein